jgi:AcrR family transcriptional regulator
MKKRQEPEPEISSTADAAVLASVQKASTDDSVEVRIRRGAAAAFGRLGYAGTSVEAILEEAGVSRRTFYKHFRSKEDVFRALYDRAVGRLLRAVKQADVPSEGGVVARVIKAVEAYIEVHEKAGPLARVMLLEQFSPGSPLARQRDEAMATFARLISRGARKAGAGEPDPILVMGVVAAINRICVQLAQESAADTWDTHRAKRAILRLLTVLDERGVVQAMDRGVEAHRSER